MTRAEYEKAVCARRDQAVHVDPLEVEIGDWHPRESNCHDNVDAWVKEHPEFQPVRGWVTYASFGGTSFGLTAHSVVRDSDGKLRDITPLANEALRAWMHFIEHEGDHATFADMKRQDINIHCFEMGGEE